MSDEAPVLRPNAVTPHYQRVKRFMQLARQEMYGKPTMPSEETRLLRARLILEEALETVKALGVAISARQLCCDAIAYFNMRVSGDADLEAIADGCADLSVVNVGTLIACGIKDAALLEAVDYNNALKFRHICPKCGKDFTDLPPESPEVLASVQPMTAKRCEVGLWRCCECGTEWRSGYRRADGKWVKPENHEPPDIRAVLEAQGRSEEEGCGRRE